MSLPATSAHDGEHRRNREGRKGRRGRADRSRRALALVGVASLTMLGTLVAVGIGGSAASAAVSGPVPGYDYSHAITPLAGCETGELPGNDDGYVAEPQPLGFDVNFYGNSFSNAYVNNNGNITFDAPSGEYVPFPLEDASAHPIIAPFFTDVDTRGPGRTVHYGSGTSPSGQKYFCVDWIQVAQYSENDSQGLDSFQLVLYDASAVPGNHAGDFDIEFNYDTVPWDHGGSARAGFAAGTGVTGTSLELPGGGQNGAMVDGGPNALVSSSANSATPGRYHFPIRGNGIVNTGSFTGAVTDQDGNPVPGGTVQACRTTGYCRTGVSNPDGTYTVSNLAAGDYALTVSPPDGSGNPAHGTGTLTSNTDTETVNLQLTVPQTAPPGTTIGDQNGTTTVDGVVLSVLYWGDPHPLSFTGCPGATSAQVRFDGFYLDGTPYTSTVTAVEDPAAPGTYRATIPVFVDIQVHGDLTIHELLDCGSGPGDVSFTVYIDPSGTVVDQNGSPVDGATVTLLGAESADGTFTAVPSGSTVMSPANRRNPDHTDSQGRYGWDVTAGYYEVEATKAGCNTVDSDALQIPPAVTGLVLHLDCTGTGGGDTTPPTVDAGMDALGMVSTAIAIAGTASDDTAVASTQWSVPTGTPCTFADAGALSTTVTCTMTGTYVLTLTATDTSGNTSSDTATVDVLPQGTVGKTCDGLTPTITGTAGDDTITGTSGPDVILAGAGNDVINGLGGDDVICGGAGNDTIQGSTGKDRIFGDGGNDRIYGGRGNDFLVGNSGNDRIFGQAGNDTVYGDDGNDHARGGNGDDALFGGDGSDKLVGASGDNSLNGGAGSDVCGSTYDVSDTYSKCEVKIS